MMSVVVSVSVSVIVIRVGIDMLFSNKQKTNKQRIMNHEYYAPTILVYHHLTIPGKQERKKGKPKKKKVKYTHPLSYPAVYHTISSFPFITYFTHTHTKCTQPSTSLSLYAEDCS